MPAVRGLAPDRPSLGITMVVQDVQLDMVVQEECNEGLQLVTRGIEINILKLPRRPEEESKIQMSIPFFSIHPLPASASAAAPTSSSLSSEGYIRFVSFPQDGTLPGLRAPSPS